MTDQDWHIKHTKEEWDEHQKKVANLEAQVSRLKQFETWFLLTYQLVHGSFKDGSTQPQG